MTRGQSYIGRPLLPTDVSVRQRANFWSKVDKRTDDECWLWKGYRAKNGYGRVGFNGVVYEAHKVAWIITNEAPAHPLFVCHSCDVRHCCNPRHLWKGTRRANVDDMVRKDRSPHGIRCASHKLTPRQVRQIRALSEKGATRKSLACRFGVTHSNILQIIRRQTWRRVL